MATETAHRPPLLDQVRERCRVKHFSLRTEQAYVHWIRRLIVLHDKRHPREMGGPEVEALLIHLAVQEKVRRRPRTRRWAQSCFWIGRFSGYGCPGLMGCGMG